MASSALPSAWTTLCASPLRRSCPSHNFGVPGNLSGKADDQNSASCALAILQAGKRVSVDSKLVHAHFDSSRHGRVPRIRGQVGFQRPFVKPPSEPRVRRKDPVHDGLQSQILGDVQATDLCSVQRVGVPRIASIYAARRPTPPRTSHNCDLLIMAGLRRLAQRARSTQRSHRIFRKADSQRSGSGAAILRRLHPACWLAILRAIRERLADCRRS